MSAAHRFFVEASAFAPKGAALEGPQARQIADVLRLGPGDEIVLVHDGEEARVRLVTVTRERVDGVVVARGRAASEPRVRVTLALPLLRGDRSEEVVEAVTQLGVSRIVPFTSARSVVRELSEGKRRRWERIARESAETARRGRVPEIGPLVAWPDLFDRLEPQILVAWEEEQATTLRMGLPGAAPSVSLVIGPEGGLTADEVEVARGRGATPVSLGGRNLRSETAAISAVAQLVALVEG